MINGKIEISNGLTEHAMERSSQRGITSDMINAAFRFGQEIYAKSTLYYFIGKKQLRDIRKHLSVKNPENYEGITLVLDPKTNTVITCYRNKEWLKKIRYKH